MVIPPRKPFALPVMYNRPGPITHPEVFAGLYREGLRMVHVDATCTDDIYHPELIAWKAPGVFDYSVQEEGWKRLIEVGPEFKFCLRLYMGSPLWWDEAHPDELQRYADGSVHHEFRHTDRTTVPSLASKVWRDDSIAALNHFLDWLDGSGWSDRVWGLFPSFGITWEWGILGTDGLPDYSEPAVAGFRRWLAEHYASEDALRQAWGERRATFETAQIPTAAERLREPAAGRNGLRSGFGEGRGDAPGGDVRRFPQDRPSYDYQRFLSWCNVRLLDSYAAAIRAHSGSRFRVGAFYGYTVTAREHSEIMGRMGSGGLLGGHHALAEFEAGGHFDFIASPYAYANRNLEDGLIIQHFPLASVQYGGLEAYEENDLRTFTNIPATPPAISFGITTTRRESILHQRLAFAQAVCRGTSYWLTEIIEKERMLAGASNYSDPEVLAEVGRHLRALNALADQPRRSVAEIAIVIDEEAKDRLALGSKLFLREVYDQLGAWGWCGAPFDVWLASDFLRDGAPTARYKLVYVFAPSPDPPATADLARAYAHAGRTVWLGPNTVRGAAGGGIVSMSCAGLSSADLTRIARHAGVHLYAEVVQVMAGREEASGSDLDYICVHVRDAGRYRISLPTSGTPGDGTAFTDVFTGKRLGDDGGFDYEPLDVALFVRDGTEFPSASPSGSNPRGLP